MISFLTQLYWGFHVPVAGRSWFSTLLSCDEERVSQVSVGVFAQPSPPLRPHCRHYRGLGETLPLPLTHHTPVSSMTDASSPSNDGFSFFSFFNTLHLKINFFPYEKGSVSWTGSTGVDPAATWWKTSPNVTWWQRQTKGNLSVSAKREVPDCTFETAKNRIRPIRLLLRPCTTAVASLQQRPEQ